MITKSYVFDQPIARHHEASRRHVKASRRHVKALVSYWFCLGFNEKALVLHWFCLGSNEKALVLPWFCSGHNEKALVLHWFCVRLNEKHWFYKQHGPGHLGHPGFRACERPGGRAELCGRVAGGRSLGVPGCPGVVAVVVFCCPDCVLLYSFEVPIDTH